MAERAEGLLLKIIDVDFPPDRAHVGSARRLAMDLAAREAPSGVILTTDADAVPPTIWVERNLRAVHAGADIVGGRDHPAIRRRRRGLGQAFLRRAATYSRYDALRDELASVIDPLEHDPWPRHRDHTGASIAVCSQVYAAVGGMEPLPFRRGSRLRLQGGGRGLPVEPSAGRYRHRIGAHLRAGAGRHGPTVCEAG